MSFLTLLDRVQFAGDGPHRDRRPPWSYHIGDPLNGIFYPTMDGGLACEWTARVVMLPTRDPSVLRARCADVWRTMGGLA